MGILNVTPDSFSDGGRFLDAASAVQQGLLLVREGADILDIGGESTRPGAEPVTLEEECRRVLPVVEELSRRTQIAISIDTQKPDVARAAIQAGAVMINDIAANREDESMWRLAAESGAGYVAMHMQGTPRTMQASPQYGDVVAEVTEFFRNRLERMQACGVRLEQLALDPGIGFGKTLDQNVRLLSGLKDFRGFARPIVLGVSRKSFLGGLTGAGVGDRMPAGLACSVWAAFCGVSVLRTHDVAPTIQALRVFQAISERKL